ncbi:hypothetical protein FRC11_014693 [Ceratobasidium sp. 423]|nr:hypothetical protein FRC11_014693 [Ceratobasidium sp. 423]
MEGIQSTSQTSTGRTIPGCGEVQPVSSTLAIILLPEPFDVSAMQSGAGPAKDVEVSVGGVTNSLMQYEDQVININDSDSDSVDPWDKYGASIKHEAILLPSLGAIQQTTEVLMTSLAQQSGS